MAILRNLPYTNSYDPKQTLDLYKPNTSNAPVLIFVHGGGWDTGDKDLDVHGHRVYQDIGKNFADHGILTAVINYRLLPKVSWREQLRDVANAISWVHSHAAEYGGDPGRFFVMGHSAGAQLGARVAVDPDLLGGQKIVSGVIAVSGAGYEIKHRLSYYARRFQGTDTTDNWQREASLTRFLSPSSPPFLILYGSKEPRPFHEESKNLATLTKSKLVEIPDRDHVQMAVELSVDESTATRSVLDFVNGKLEGISKATVD